MTRLRCVGTERQPFLPLTITPYATLHHRTTTSVTKNLPNSDNGAQPHSSQQVLPCKPHFFPVCKVTRSSLILNRSKSQPAHNRLPGYPRPEHSFLFYHLYWYLWPASREAASNANGGTRKGDTMRGGALSWPELLTAVCLASSRRASAGTQLKKRIDQLCLFTARTNLEYTNIVLEMTIRIYFGIGH